MKKIKKVTIILLIMLMFVASISCYSSVFGQSVLESFNGRPKGGAPIGATKVATIVGAILQVIRIAGAGIAVVMILILGIKYTIASAADRADIKKSANIYVIGALIMFGASGILGILQDVIVNSLGKSGE